MAGPRVYDNLDLLFEQGGDGYRVRVTHSPGGADVPAQPFVVPFEDRDLENFVLRLRGSKDRARGALDSPETQRAREMGSDLYEALFKDRLATTLSTSTERCEGSNQGLRLRLNLTDTPALLNLPWEFLYDESTKTFLSLSYETPIVRYLAVGHRAVPLRTPLPVRVLVMVSNPDDPNYEELDVEQEKAKLKTAVRDLEDAGQLFLDFIPATLRDLTYALDKNTYHVFHFIGHGGFDEASNEGALVLEGDRRASITGGQHLGQLLADHSSLRLAVLNACEGARSANNDPFAGVAQTLLQQGVPAAVAMQFEITDKAAITFSEGFYTSLTHGQPVDVAVSGARKDVYSIPNYTEWATPVLYMRSPDGVLFDLQEPAPPIKEPKPEPGRDDVVEPPPPLNTGGSASEGQTTSQRSTEEISEPPQLPSILEPLRRAPTLLLLGLSMLAFGFSYFFQARYFATSNVQYLKAGHYAPAFGWGLGAAAAYLGASLVGKSARGESTDTNLLLLGGVSLTVSALGSLMFAIGKYGSQGPGFLNISLGLVALGILVVGFLCFVLANKYRGLMLGPRRHSPVGPLVLAGIGICLYTTELYLNFSWVTNFDSNLAHGCYILSSLGLVALSGALVLTGIYRAGPVIRLSTAAVALLILALANIVFAYSRSHNAPIYSSSVTCLCYVLLAIVFFVSPLLTRPSRLEAKT